MSPLVLCDVCPPVNSEHVRKYPWTRKVIVMFRMQVGDVSGTVTLQTIRELERAGDGVRCGLAALGCC